MIATILSPHLDDAVLSLGQYMQTRPCNVLTVYAGWPESGVTTDYDIARGFTCSVDAVAHRRAEDRAARSILGAGGQWLDFTDAQYATVDDRTLAHAIARHVQPDTFVPLGLGHPDHRQLARCVRAVAKRGVPLFFYEELPYRVLWPEQAHDALLQLRDDGFEVQELPFPLEQGLRFLKEQAIAAYASQFPNGADDPCLLVPERCWRAVKCA